jgi:capsule polysaccharide export protein KpsE/RkpR
MEKNIFKNDSTYDANRIDGEANLKLLLVPFILSFYKKRLWLVSHFILICLCAWIYVFYFVEVEYRSSVTFFPPVSESALGTLIAGISIPSANSSILPEQIVTIFNSNVLKKNILDKFNLYEHYKLLKSSAKYTLASKILAKDLTIEAEESGGLGLSKTISYTLSSFHNSADTACLISKHTFSLLDSAVQAISADQAHRSRVFIEGQLNKSRSVADSLQFVMTEFQRANKIYDIPEQLKMTMTSYAQLKAKLLANQIQIQSQKYGFTGKTTGVEALEQQNKTFEDKLLELENSSSPDALPSFERSIKLAPEYAALFRDLEVQNQLILVLTQEYEQARIKESKNVSTLAVIDDAFVADYKARPKRLFELAKIIVIYMAFIVSMMSGAFFYTAKIKTSASYGVLKKELQRRS